MRRLIACLLLLPLLTAGQSIDQIIDAKIKASEQRSRAYTDSVFKMKPTDPPVDPDPVFADCKSGPRIEGIGKITNTSLEFTFDAEEVHRISWEIQNLAGQALSKGVTDSLKSNRVPISFGVLANAPYNLVIQGFTCKSTPNERRFTVKSETGSVDPPIVRPPPTNPGAAVAKRVYTGLPENMDVQVTKTDKGWLLSDLATILPQNGREFRYGINGVVIKTQQPLKDYLWPSNTPLMVWKAQPRPNLKSLVSWCEQCGMYDPDAAAGFNFNDSYPHAIFYFQKQDSAYNANRRTAHWMDFQPDLKLPPGQVWVMPIGSIDSPDLLIRKGVTHFSKYEVSGKSYEGQLISAGRLYDEVPKTPEQFNLHNGTGVSNWVPKRDGGDPNDPNAPPVGWPEPWNEMYFGKYKPGQTEPITYEEGRQAGRVYQTNMPLVVFENSENNHAVGAQWAFVRGFYETYIPRLKSEWIPKGIMPLVAHNYFTTFGGTGYAPLTLGYAGRAENKAVFNVPVSEWGFSQLLPGGTLELTTAVCYGYYLDAPDNTLDQPYKFIFSAKVARKAGKATILFPQSFHEDRPNNFQEIQYPDGKFYLQGKMKHNPAELITISFLAQTFGAGTIPFGAGAKSDENFRFLREFHGNKGNLWRPNNNPNQNNDNGFPYYIASGPENFPSGPFEYGLSEGVRMYSETFAKVRGGNESFLEYRIDGKGEFSKPDQSYAGDLVDAFYDKRGVVYAQEKDGLAAIFYLNPYADNDLHTVEYKYRGKVYQMTVHSTLVYPVLHRL